MALDALAKSRIKAQHRAERDDMADRHASERQQLTAQNHAAQQRDVEEARKRLNSPSRHFGDHGSVGTKDFTKAHVAAHAKLKARQDKEYDDLRQRHAKETETSEKTGRVPASAARTPEGKKVDQAGMNPREHSEYQGIVRKFSNEHARVHNADEATKDRFARYKSSAMAQKMEEGRLTHHDEISRKAEQSLANLRRKVEARKGAA
jgi:hypothetical protein